MAHSNQVREFLLTRPGHPTAWTSTSAPATVLTGSARLVQEAQDKAQAAAEQQAIARRRRELEQEQALAAAQLEALQLKTATLAEELETLDERRAGPA